MVKAVNELKVIYDQYEDGDTYLPEELKQDERHPSQDEFKSEVAKIKREIAKTKASMKAKQSLSIQHHFDGKDFTWIGKKINTTAITVSRYVNSNEGRKLLALINHLQAKLDGPGKEHRKGILYRIALDCEEKKPSIAIQALAEISKMSGSYDQAHSQVVNNITINGELLPRGQLDELPPVHTIEYGGAKADD